MAEVLICFLDPRCISSSTPPPPSSALSPLVDGEPPLGIPDALGKVGSGASPPPSLHSVQVLLIQRSQALLGNQSLTVHTTGHVDQADHHSKSGCMMLVV